MKILVSGGYGNFGKRLVASLLQHHDHDLVVAGRSPQRAAALRGQYRRDFGKTFACARLDVTQPDLLSRLRDLDVDMVVNACGPFRAGAGSERYPLASACARAGMHYVDLADDREYVCGFAASLDQLARDRRVTLVSGASTVPGLSAAVIDYYLDSFASLQSVDYGISPGNRSERGEATVASILSYTGRPFEILADDRRRRVYGWQGLRRVDLGPPLGHRWMGYCNIPDLDLLPARYPDLETLRFQAGLEVAPLHFGLWLLALLARARLVDDWSRYAAPLTAVSDWFRDRGSDRGGMFVDLAGSDHAGRQRRLRWLLVAENGVGPNIPTIAAELVVERIGRGKIGAGAMPCLGLFKLADFMRVARRWGIYATETGHV